MFACLFSVRHGHCALCGAEAQLFTLHVTRGEEPRLEPKAPTTHTGACAPCWLRTGLVCVNRAWEEMQKDSVYAKSRVTRVDEASECDMDKEVLESLLGKKIVRIVAREQSFLRVFLDDGRIVEFQGGSYTTYPYEVLTVTAS